MTPKRKVHDKDIIGSYAALLRAAETARLVAYTTNTPVIIMENGRIVEKWITRKDLKSL